jgi:GNAT superfamily N-acetyltransferase
MVGVVAGVLEEKTLHLVWLTWEARRHGLADQLLSEVERLAQARGAGIVFAQTEQCSELYQLLVRLGFIPDAVEPDVISGRLAHSVDLFKILGPQ